MIWTVFYGLLTACMAWTAWQRQARDARSAITLLAGLYIATNIADYWAVHPYNQLFPILDAAAAALMVWTWRRRLTAWKVALIALLEADGVVHVLYFRSGNTSFAARHAYDLRLNILYVGQLACVLMGCLWYAPRQTAAHATATLRPWK